MARISKLFGALAIGAAAAAGIYFSGDRSDIEPAADPMQAGRAIVEENQAKPCAAEMAARSPVLLARKGMDCPKP